MIIPIEIIITDFVEDPVDESSFGINFQINGPGTRVEYLRVSFSDAFIEAYFKITVWQDLAEEEKKIQNEKRDLFIRWAVYRLERWLEDGRKEENIIVDDDGDLIWTRKIEKGMLKPAGEQKEERKFVYSINIPENELPEDGNTGT